MTMSRLITLLAFGAVWCALPTGAQQTPPCDPPKTTESYTLGVGDVISVSIWGDGRFDGTYTINPDGKISIKLIGEIQASGLTRQQMQDAVDKAALKEIRNPQSSVNLLASHSKHIYFSGEGVGAGVMDLVMPIHLLEALATRGCCRDFARKGKMQVLRDGKPYLHDEGGKKVAYFNYDDLLTGKHPEANILLQDGDHVIVP